MNRVAYSVTGGGDGRETIAAFGVVNDIDEQHAAAAHAASTALKEQYHDD